MKNSILILGISIMLFSCSVVPQEGVYNEETGEYEVIITESLFNSPDATLSEENIQRLLDGKILIPDSIKIAVFNCQIQTRTYRYYYNEANNEERIHTLQQYLDTLINTISVSEKVCMMKPMPSIMADKNSGIQHLRETSVRMQANYLLIFSIKSDIYYKYRAFKADEAKAYATVEIALMDVRTGLVPFTSVITKEAHLKKNKEDDLTTKELQKRAEKAAVISSLSESGIAVFQYFHQISKE